MLTYGMNGCAYPFSPEARKIKIPRRTAHRPQLADVDLHRGLWLALIIGICVNVHNFETQGPVFPDESLRNLPSFLPGARRRNHLCRHYLSLFLFILGYVYRDAKRRGMNPALWTILVLILSPGYVFSA